MNGNNPTHSESSPGTNTAYPVAPSTLLSADSLSTGRLLIPVPEDLDYGSAVRRIWQLATATHKDVHLLGLCKDRPQELSLRRQLISMTALLINGGIPAEAKIEIGTRWNDAIRRNYQTGDILVCFAEQRYGLLHKPLSQILEADLDAPVFILSDLHLQRSSKLNLLSLLLGWGGLITIIAGAFLLQTRILALPSDWVQTTFLLLSLFGEFWLIWAWNNLFR